MLSPIRSSGSRLQGGAFRRLVRISAQAWAHLRYSPIRRGMSSVFTRNPAAEDRGAAARRDPIVVHMVVRVLALSGLAATLQDRKSTRLNSSHLVISYAVFCL